VQAAKVVIEPKKLAGMDEVSAAAVALGIDNKHCGFKSCKAIVDLMGTNCRFCKGRFCFGHIQPEVHGCGDEAKRHAHESSIRKFEEHAALDKFSKYVVHPPPAATRGRGAPARRGRK
jgi:predicted nucleic acid binding AN1-type Zn finger protein